MTVKLTVNIANFVWDELFKIKQTHKVYNLKDCTVVSKDTIRIKQSVFQKTKKKDPLYQLTSNFIFSDVIYYK